jgi:hypothetical protein
MNKKTIIITSIGIAIVVIAILALMTTVRFVKGSMYRMEPSYTYTEPGMGSCMAMMPECGVCVQSNGEYGIVENKICYLPL